MIRAPISGAVLSVDAKAGQVADLHSSLLGKAVAAVQQLPVSVDHLGPFVIHEDGIAAEALEPAQVSRDGVIGGSPRLLPVREEVDSNEGAAVRQAQRVR